MTQAETTSKMNEIATKIAAYALDCYNYGWDFIVETMTNDTIIEELTDAGITSYSKALAYYRNAVAIYKEQRAEHEYEIRAAAPASKKEKRIKTVAAGDVIRLEEYHEEDSGIECGATGKVRKVSRLGQVEAVFSGVVANLIVGVDRFTVMAEA